MEITIATGNNGKFLEITQKLEGIVSCRQEIVDIPELQTNLLTEISADKCIQAYELMKGPVLVDDTGIYFEAFNEFPGALTKFLYQGVGLEGIQNLFTGVKNRNAIFQCVLSYMDETLKSPIQFLGEVEGVLNFELVGTMEPPHKLPFDLIFQPKGMNAPAITEFERWKKEFSHRGRAAEKFAIYLSNRK